MQLSNIRPVIRFYTPLIFIASFLGFVCMYAGVIQTFWLALLVFIASLIGHLINRLIAQRFHLFSYLPLFFSTDWLVGATAYRWVSQTPLDHYFVVRFFASLTLIFLLVLSYIYVKLTPAAPGDVEVYTWEDFEYDYESRKEEIMEKLENLRTKCEKWQKKRNQQIEVTETSHEDSNEPHEVIEGETPEDTLDASREKDEVINTVGSSQKEDTVEKSDKSGLIETNSVVEDAHAVNEEQSPVPDLNNHDDTQEGTAKEKVEVKADEISETKPTPDSEPTKDVVDDVKVNQNGLKFDKPPVAPTSMLDKMTASPNVMNEKAEDQASNEKPKQQPIEDNGFFGFEQLSENMNKGDR